MSTGRPRDPMMRDVAIGGALFAAAMGYFALSFPYSLWLSDEGYFYALSSIVASGGLPHRDFSDLYGPGVYWLNGALLGVAGGQVLSIKAAIAVVKAAAVVCSYGLVRGLVGAPFAVLGALLAIPFWGRSGWPLNTPYAAIYTVAFCLVAGVVLIRSLERNSRAGLFASGAIAGCAILFKHSLALLCVGGLGVAIWSVSLLAAPAGRATRSDRVWAVAPLVAAGLAILVPFASMLSLRDYAIHFTPFHALLGLVAAAVIRRRPALDVRPIVVQRLAPFGLGAALAPAAALGVYASLGGLDGLARDLFVYPLRMKNYYMASRTPPVDAALLVAGAVFATSAVLSALRGRWRGALAMALPGLAGVGLGLSLHAVAGPSAAASGSAWLHTRNFDEVFGPLAVLAGTCALAPLLLAGTDGVAQRRALPVLFLGATFVFQAFPRGFLSSWIVEAACLPALTWALFRWRRLGLGERVGMFRRGVATLLVLLIPIWMASHALAPNGPIRRFGASRRALDLPGVAGVELDAGSIRFGAWPQIEALIAHIRRVEPADAPVLLFGQAWMIVFLSGRPMLYPKRSLPLILLSIDMLRDAEIAELDEAAMLEQLRNAPDAIVIDEQGPESKRMRTGLPRLSAFLDREYTRRTQFGRYAVLRREPSAGFQAERR